MDPLVTILMPCHNMAASLPLALGSLIIQTYENWECVLVDDGSEDRPSEIVDTLNDKRIRYIRLEKNMGRGFARGVALDCARGDLVTMLDADDWLFPDRLAKQCELLQAFPGTALVDAGVAVIDGAKELRGVLRSNKGTEPLVTGPFKKLRSLPVSAHAACMIRADIAKQARFDPTLRRAEDQDFLLQVLMGRCHISWGQLHYCYAGFKKVSLDEILASYDFQERVYAKYESRFPLSSRLQRLKIKLKSAIRRRSHRFEGDRFLSYRYELPGMEDEAKFACAERRIINFVEGVFGAGPWKGTEVLTEPLVGSLASYRIC